MGSLARYFEKQGLAKGKVEGKKETAMARLSETLDTKVISKVTSPSIQEIYKLREETLSL